MACCKDDHVIAAIESHSLGWVDTGRGDHCPYTATGQRLLTMDTLILSDI